MGDAGYTVVDWLSAGLAVCTIVISFMTYLYFKAKLEIKSLKGENEGLDNRRITQLYVDQQEERMEQLYEKALAAMRRYSSCEEYLSAEPGARKPINLTSLSSFIQALRCRINEYDCCVDDSERGRVGTEILYWCRSLGQYDCVGEDE